MTGQQPGADGPLSGIEVRTPCPYCPPPAMIPRTLLAEHITDAHPGRPPLSVRPRGGAQADPDLPCPHEDFEAVVEVNRLAASDDRPTEIIGYSADIRVRCVGCLEPFRWVGVPAGMSPGRPMCSVDETELHAPLRPASADPDFGLGIPGFAIRYRSSPAADEDTTRFLVDRPFRSLRKKPVDDNGGASTRLVHPCAQHPDAPVIGGMCGGCTVYPVNKEQT